MTTDNNKDMQLSRRGSKKHTTNPFMQTTVKNTAIRSKKISNPKGDKLMIVSEGTGEVVAPAGFWQSQEVDKTQFVKLYINGVKAFKDLSSAGTKVFEVLYTKIQREINKDVLYLTFHDVDQLENQMSESTYMRGMKELIKKDFLAESMSPGRYFLNPDFLWNGDRLAFVKEFKLKSSKPQRDPKTVDFLNGRADSDSE